MKDSGRKLHTLHTSLVLTHLASIHRLLPFCPPLSNLFSFPSSAHTHFFFLGDSFEMDKGEGKIKEGPCHTQHSQLCVNTHTQAQTRTHTHTHLLWCWRDIVQPLYSVPESVHCEGKLFPTLWILYLCFQAEIGQIPCLGWESRCS